MDADPSCGPLNVYILRHAKADFGSKGDDPPVSTEGEKELLGVLDLAKEHLGFRPTLAVSSPIQRARQPADLVRKKMGGDFRTMVDDCLNPDSQPAEVLKFLGAQKAKDVVLISHMPLIFELLPELIGRRGEVELLNGSIAAVRFEGKAEAGKGKLVCLVQPER